MKICIIITAGLLALCLCAIVVMEANEAPKTKYIFLSMRGWQCPTKAILVDNGIDEQDVESCIIWAFGKDHNKLRLDELDDKWRERHSDLFEIAGYDCIIESTKKIAKVYLETKQD